MSVIEGIDAVLSLRARGRSFPPCELGLIMPGFYYFGSEPIYLQMPGKEAVLISGIFQKRYNMGRAITALVSYMIPKNPRTEAQQANREKYADGVLAWQNLTTEQKQVYNDAMRGKKMSGYNFFLREYLKSH